MASSQRGRNACRRAVGEALRWGQPTVEPCPPLRLVWAVPLMHNDALLGGLVAGVSESKVFGRSKGKPGLDVRQACNALQTLAEKANLTNAALLATRRQDYHRERQRAEAIHQLKLIPCTDVRQMYLRDEPDLVAAIRKDERSEARGILNRILSAIAYQSGNRLDLMKSFFMELVVTMCRTAVEAGANPESVFGENFVSISELATIDSQQRLAPWLHDMLERIMDAIRSRHGQSPIRLLSAAMDFMTAHCTSDITRDQVARAVHVSPSHFSRMMKHHLGRTYTDLLNQMRVNRACELLARTDMPLAAVALDSGFNDQSYFTKVFRRYSHLTPRQYRLKRQQPQDETS